MVVMGVGYRIMAAAAERVAAKYPVYAERKAFHQTVLFQCDEHVFGTCRVESAGSWQQGRNGSFINKQ